MSGDRPSSFVSFVSTQERGLSGTFVSSVSSPGRGFGSWLGRLKAIQSEKALRSALTKPTEASQNGRYPYRFKLRDGGGTYITHAATLEEARDELLARWPEDLIDVSRTQRGELTQGETECEAP